MTPVLHYPPPLKKNDTLGVIAPAGQIKDLEPFQNGIRVLKEMGFSVKVPGKLWPGRHYLADSDENRAKELNDCFKDPEIDGIIALRGGYGCLRLLDRIDLDLVERFPKALIGYSDISILLNYLYDRTGLVSFHGPVLTTLASADPYSLGTLQNCLDGKWRTDFQDIKITILKDGPTVRGPLVGGNLSSLVTLLGTRFDCSWKDKIIVLEDTNEPIYKIDRMLTHLHLSGKLEQAAGLILGDFSNDSHRDDREKVNHREAVWKRVLELIGKTSLVVWAGLPAGHISSNQTFPIGADFQMNHELARLKPCF